MRFCRFSAGSSWFRILVGLGSENTGMCVGRIGLGSENSRGGNLNLNPTKIWTTPPVRTVVLVASCPRARPGAAPCARAVPAAASCYDHAAPGAAPARRTVPRRAILLGGSSVVRGLTCRSD